MRGAQATDKYSPDLLRFVRLLAQKQEEGFYGSIEIHLAAGKIKGIKCNESILPEHIEGKLRTA